MGGSYYRTSRNINRSHTMNYTHLASILTILPTLGQKLFEQLYLSGLALFFACAIGIPLGIMIARKPLTKQLTLSLVNIVQTIPSLALFAFLLPFMGIGVKPAITALTFYALLPIVRNTVTGLTEIDHHLIEAANSLGFTYWQRLKRIEIPLALPTLIAGLRTATAMCVGIATIATFIGAGGLGDFISQGLAMNNIHLVMLGAIPAAILALCLDAMFAMLERRVVRYRKPVHHKNSALRWLSAIPIATLIIIVSLPLVSLHSFTRKNTITIGSKNFTEQFILAYMMADLIHAKTQLPVRLKLNLGATDICQQALLDGNIDLYPEYTGTAYQTILHRSKSATPKHIYAMVKQYYQQHFHLTWLKPLGFNNTQALAVNTSFADIKHISSISQLVPLASTLTVGAPAEFTLRADAYPGLKKTYHLNFNHIKQMDPGIMYKAIKNHRVNVIMAFSTDGRIRAYHLKLLRDDKHFFPSYLAAPVIRDATLKAHPEIKQALQPLYGLLTNKIMQQLNYDVDVLHQLPKQVALRFLKQHHLMG